MDNYNIDEQNQKDIDSALDDDIFGVKQDEDSPEEGTAKKKGVLLNIITTQAIITVVVIIVFVLLQTFSPTHAEQIKQDYLLLSADGVLIEDIVGVFQTPVPTEQATSSEAASAEVSSEMTSIEVVSKQKSSSKPKSNKKKDSLDVELGQGGGANPVKLSQAELLSPPARTTFLPVTVSQKVVEPVKGGSISSYFGYRYHPRTKVAEFHKALDIAAGKGVAIRAAADGVVVSAQFSKSLGKFVTIKHDGGFVTRYGHCSKLLVKKGERVKQGKVIARVGSTGDSTGNHLHFETTKNGTAFNPLWLFSYD